MIIKIEVDYGDPKRFNSIEAAQKYLSDQGRQAERQERVEEFDGCLRSELTSET